MNKELDVNEIQKGDLVDDEIVEYFLNVLPPKT